MIKSFLFILLVSLYLTLLKRIPYNTQADFVFLQVNIKYFTYPGALGNEYVSNKIEFDYDHYFPF